MSTAAVAGWAVEAMVASAVLMAAVLLLRRPVRRGFGPRVAYALWALPLLRLLLPPLPSGWRAVAAGPVARAGETVVLIVAPSAPVAAVPPLAAPPQPSTVAALLFALWLAGAAALLAVQLVRHRRYCRRILADAVPVDAIGGVRIVTSAAATGPIAFGVRRRWVALPADFADRYDAGERALALAHEIGHHRRGDLMANWAALAVLALHWFSPLAWYAHRAFRADQELANDAAVLAGRSPGDRHAYACAIVKAAHGRSLPAACHLHTVDDLKGRLRMLATSPASRRRLASGAVAVAALAVAGLGLTASSGGAAAIGRHVEQAVAPPEPPLPPAPPASVVAPAPPAPPAPPAGPHNVRRVVIVKDGRTIVSDGADIDAHLAAGDRVSIAPLAPGSTRMIVKMPDDPDAVVEVQDMPAVRSATCGIGTGRPAEMVIASGTGGRRKIVVCTDRIRQAALNARAAAGNAQELERTAYTRALSGLTDARIHMLANADLGEADRRRALGAIDQSIAEMKERLAHLD